jgi:hypothetical protein
VLAGVLGWTVTRPNGGGNVFIPYPIDAFAFLDAALVDAAPDSPPAEAGAPGVPIDVDVAWARKTIYNSIVGADGVDLADVDLDGFLDITTPWEDTGKITVSFHPGYALSASPWPTIELDGGIGAGEGSLFCDVDLDGHMDVIATSETEKIIIYFSPTNPAQARTAGAWTTVEVTIANGITNWMQAACADFVPGDSGSIEIIAGGKLYPGQEIGLFATATPRVAGSWTHTKIGDAGWIMAMVNKDVDGDGDQDVVFSDRTYYGPSTDKHGELTGSRWLENSSSGTVWTNHTINKPTAKGDPKWMDATGTLTVYDCSSDATRNFVQKWTTTNWLTWTGTQIYGTSGSPAVPSSVGQCQDMEPADLDNDGDLDLIISFAFATDAKSVIIWMRNNGDGTYTRGEMGGAGLLDGTKADNIKTYDVDGDGDLDAITTLAEPEQLGLVVFCNPFFTGYCQ